MTLAKQIVPEIIEKLRAEYPQAGCELDFDSTFHLLISVVLSAQTTDKSVNRVTPALFAKYPDAFSLAQADQEDVMEFIRSIGMYKTKSRNIIALSKKLVSEFDGIVPDNQKDLESLPGVGRKTANVVMAEAFGAQRIAVDTHVFRVSNRIGLVAEKDVVKTENALMEVLPDDKWTLTHHLLIFHGRYCCSARKPACERCPLAHLCEKNGVD